MSVPLPGPAITTLKILASLVRELCFATSGREADLKAVLPCSDREGACGITVSALTFLSVARMDLLHEEGGMYETSLLLAQLR